MGLECYRIGAVFFEMYCIPPAFDNCDHQMCCVWRWINLLALAPLRDNIAPNYYHR